MIFLFLSELIILFLLSRRLTSELSYLFYSIFRSRRAAVWMMAIIFLPGTIIHEFAHAIAAHILRVYVGKMELMPQLDGDSLKLGSVEVGKTDVIRNFFIGVAPFVIGTALLLVVLFYAFQNNVIGLNILTLFILLFTFIIANTMYSSKKDMEGAIEFIIIVTIPALFFYLLGVRIPGLNWQTLNSGAIEEFFRSASLFLGLPILLDSALIIFARILRR